jgi:hypothetical protein
MSGVCYPFTAANVVEHVAVVEPGGEGELLAQFLHPLPDQVPRRDDQDPPQLPFQDQPPQDQARLDGLAQADLVAEQVGAGERVNRLPADPGLVWEWLLSGSMDQTVKVWGAEKGQELLTLKGHTGGVTSVCFSPDGKRILSGSDDNTVKGWDADKGQELLTLQGHTDQVTSVSFSPDGKRFLSGSADGAVKVWDASRYGEANPAPRRRSSRYLVAPLTGEDPGYFWNPAFSPLAALTTASLASSSTAPMPKNL